MDKLTAQISFISLKKILLAILSGLLLTASFPAPNFSYLAWISIIPLLYSIRDVEGKKAFLLGLISGLSHYLTLMYWIINTIKTYGELPFILGLLLLLLLALYLSLYIALFCCLITKFCLTSKNIQVYTPIIWILLEYLRGKLLTGFPWLLLGYSQFERLNLIQVSDIFGVYGISFLIIFVNVSLFIVFLHLTKIKWKFLQINKKDSTLSIIICFFLFLSSLLYGKWQIYNFDKKTFPLLKAAVIQGNIDQSAKWDYVVQEQNLNKYISLSKSAKISKPDIIVWPETAASFYYKNNAYLSALLDANIRAINTNFIIGSPSFERKQNETILYFNSAYLINNYATVEGRYDKVHLVPFGEYVPLKKILPFIEKIVENIGDFSNGKKGEILYLNNAKIGVQICYEVIFPELSSAIVRNGANVIVNITNDAWFGFSSAPFQHFSMVVFRAIENKKSVIRSANTGISGFIDPLGRIISFSPLFVESMLVENVPLVENQTFYSKHGDVFIFLCLCFFIFILYQNGYLKLRKE
ncbi:MAG: apolipoprotein N-acyltransferase [Desulfobacterales bacterium]|nr:apolipoprotein N-acyltransferase [Desulfobacterales bacterium]